MARFSAVRADVYDRVSRSQYYRDNLAGLTAHQRHQRLLAELQRDGTTQQPRDAAAAALASTISDEDALRAHHRFLRGPEDDEGEQGGSWGARLARKYYARLFREFAIADLSRYKESRIGMRWRTKQEVVSGKGQFTCGARGCSEAAGLCSYEVNFAYVEAGQPKQALVKLRLCEACGQKLNYGREKEYRKVGLSAMELQDQQQQQEQQRQWQQEQGGEAAAADEGRQLHHRQKRKHKDRDGKRDEGQDDEGRHQGGSGSKSSRRRSADGEGSEGDGRRPQRRQHSASDGAAAGDDGVGEADIDRWLDDMFSVPAAQ
ncbi:folate-sensitive fragile site protein Fra10Ac1-domain-containing protein [Scenedesmus sp. NREL 46B-D3]|nr:folate-sensitive fragile site protein Fra10Ac1-domain-containing protein [Scenedesmus sp. NREL 46B-D3]